MVRQERSGPIPLKARFRGWLGEVLTIIAKKLFLPSHDYTDINNVTIQTPTGTTQIDHVIVSRFGVFVVESKHATGRIYGDEEAEHWTKVLFNQTFRFQNPLRQNYRHIRALSEFLGIQRDKFHSVIVFWGNCQFRTAMPAHVLTSGYARYVKSKTLVLFSDCEVRRIVAIIKQGRLPRTWATHRYHIAQLEQRFGSMICPKCRSSLILRTARIGGNAGSQFYGCNRYPVCRYTRALDCPTSPATLRPCQGHR